MIEQTDYRIISMMIEKANRIIEIYSKNGRDRIQNEYILSDALQFEFEKMYEDSTRLSVEFRLNHPWLHIDKLRGIRNRVAHNYESVSLSILLDTAENDIPILKQLLEKALNEKE